MAKIIKQYTKFIFPFNFDKNLLRPSEVVIENKKGVKQNVFERFSQPAESLRSGLEALLSKDGGSAKIADLYKLNVNVRREFNLPPKKGESLDFNCRQAGVESKKVSITEIKLYLFETEVGFLELECEYKTEELDEYLDLNYFICEAKSDRNKFIYHEKVWNAETKQNSFSDVEFTVKELIQKLFSSFEGGAIDFSYDKVKPIIYSHILTDSCPDNVNDLLKHLNKNYKNSYKFDDKSGSVSTLHPFENSYWTASLNGVTNLSYLTTDSVTNEFFESNFYTKTKDTYYFLFLNILHQRYAVMRIMGEMGQLDRLENNYQVMKKQLRQARIYEAEAINLKFRGFFKCPSTIEHVNNYYDTLYSAFQVGSFYDNFSSDIKNLQNICSKYVERIKDREEKFKKLKAAKTEIFVSIFGTIVAEVTLFDSSWSLIEKVIGRSLSFFSPAIIILFATMLSPIITIVSNVKKQLAIIKDLESQILEQEEDNLVENDKERRKRARLLEKLKRKRKHN